MRPDGRACRGKGTVKQGEDDLSGALRRRATASSARAGRWPVLAGGTARCRRRPDKTIGSYLALCLDDDGLHPPRHAVRQRAVADATTRSTRSRLTFCSLNDIIKDANFELNEDLVHIDQDAECGGFYDDDREIAEKSFWHKDPCMKDCKKSVEITGHASVVDVTPDSKPAREWIRSWPQGGT